MSGAAYRASRELTPETRHLRRSLPAFALVVVTLGVVTLGAQSPDRTHPPKPGPPPKLSAPPVQKKTLSNGLPVWIIESHEVPLVQANLVVRSGSGDDPAGKVGLANLTAAMLDEGAGTRSSLEIADAIDGLGATLATTSTFDASAIRLNVPVARLGDALPIMTDVALRPTFPEKDLERLRQERLTALLQARDEPGAIAATAFARLVFGPAHRYGTATGGTEETLRAFNAADLKAFHAAHYVPSNATLVIVGDVRADAVVAMLERHFGAWKGAAHTAAWLPTPEQLTRGRVVLVDKPGAAQSQIRMGWVGVARSTEEYFTLDVLNTLLGGSFTSRLNQNLREVHGYTYGASSAFDMRRAPGPFVAAAAVQTDKTADAVHEFFVELTNIGKPIPWADLAKTKHYLALSFPGAFETTTQLSRKVEEQVVYGLPDGYFRDYIPGIERVTAAHVQTAAAKYIVPSRFTVVVVGDRKVVEAGLRALNLAPVEVMTVDEALGLK